MRPGRNITRQEYSNSWQDTIVFKALTLITERCVGLATLKLEAEISTNTISRGSFPEADWPNEEGRGAFPLSSGPSGPGDLSQISTEDRDTLLTVQGDTVRQSLRTSSY